MGLVAWAEQSGYQKATRLESARRRCHHLLGVGSRLS
jgi:hypothetical protein